MFCFVLAKCPLYPASVRVTDHIKMLE